GRDARDSLVAAALPAGTGARVPGRERPYVAGAEGLRGQASLARLVLVVWSRDGYGLADVDERDGSVVDVVSDLFAGVRADDVEPAIGSQRGGNLPGQDRKSVVEGRAGR